MYGYDYSYEPAMESSSFFNAVKELIRDTKEKIKDFMEKVKTKLRRLMGNKDQIVEDSAEAVKLVNGLADKIGGQNGLLATCSDLIDKLYAAFDMFSNKDTTKMTDSNGKEVQGVDYSRAGGMDRFKARGANDTAKEANAQKWREAKVYLGEEFAKAAKTAEECKDDLKELQRMGKLSYEATTKGYNGLRKIFNANGDFGTKWKKVQIAADWSTGAIRESLNKVVSLYKLGVSATNAYGNRLIMGFYSDNSGDAYEKKDRKAMMTGDRNRVKIHREEDDWNDITTKRKDIKADATKAAGQRRYGNNDTYRTYDQNDRAEAKRRYAGESVFDPDYFEPAYESYDDDDAFEMEMMDFEHSYIGSDDIFDENFF